MRAPDRNDDRRHDTVELIVLCWVALLCVLFGSARPARSAVPPVPTPPDDAGLTRSIDAAEGLKAFDTQRGTLSHMGALRTSHAYPRR